MASKGSSLECDPCTDVLSPFWGFFGIYSANFLLRPRACSFPYILFGPLILDFSLRLYVFLLWAEADSMLLHRVPWGQSRGLWVNWAREERRGHSESREAGTKFVPFFLAASPQKPDLGLRRFCVVRVWLQDECFSVKLWQCIKKVWIMFLSLFFFHLGSCQNREVSPV